MNPGELVYPLCLDISQAVSPVSSLKILLFPIALYFNWELVSHFMPEINSYFSSNPFAQFFLLSHRVPSSSADDPRYQKGWSDLVFIAYYVVFWSLIRQAINTKVLLPLARYFGIRKEQKLDRFGEQGYALVYFGVMGAWGYVRFTQFFGRPPSSLVSQRIMGQLPSFWYRTEAFWIDYPHWDMVPELKRYYLMQMAYWIQQLLVLVMRLEKPRSDHNEYVAHHIVTIWLVGYVYSKPPICFSNFFNSSWSYLINLTIIGNAMYMSMDIPDSLLSVIVPHPSGRLACLSNDFIAFETPQLHSCGTRQSCRFCGHVCCLDVSFCFARYASLTLITRLLSSDTSVTSSTSTYSTLCGSSMI